ncbi:MAG: hypothetical protein GDA56_25800 [Hormoscilla sp. GM7CHS1pb]|nr:hypothetical protein [Hormoscilla sp. GM7CHS1pb]
MVQVAAGKEVAIARISEITEKVIASDRLYQEKLDLDEMIESLVRLFDKFSVEEMKEISDEDLAYRIDRILIVEAVSGTLNDLTPEELEIFDAAVENRW